MAKRKSAIVEHEMPEAATLQRGKRRAARHSEGERATQAKAARRTAASTPAPRAARRATPERVPSVAELALRYPSITAFPGLALSTAAPSVLPAAHPSPRPHAKLSVRQCLGDLRTALAEGWEIVQPIFARPLWSVTDDSTTAFNFVLHRERATRLIVVPEGRTVERFIRDRHLSVDYRR